MNPEMNPEMKKLLRWFDDLAKALAAHDKVPASLQEAHRKFKKKNQNARTSLAEYYIGETDSIVIWLARPKASREAVLKELREQVTSWADDDEDSQEDAETLLAVVTLLERIDQAFDREDNHGDQDDG
jgi:hypothetical protein